MFALFEAIWYSILLVVYLLWKPALIFTMISLVLWGYAKIKEEKKKEEKKKKKK